MFQHFRFVVVSSLSVFVVAGGGCSSSPTGGGAPSSTTSSGSDHSSDGGTSSGSSGSSSSGGSASSSGASSSSSSSGSSGTSSGSGGSGGCGAGESACPAGCVDLQTDPLDCGSCEYRCPSGPAGTTPSCSAGKCTYTCNDASKTYCPDSGSCVDTKSDVDHCGGCGTSCSLTLPSSVNTNAVTGYACVSGKCQATVDGVAIGNCNGASDPQCAMTCDQICQAQNHVPCSPTEAVDQCGQPGACGFYQTGGASLCPVGFGCTQTMPFTATCGGASGTLDEIWCQCSGTFSY